MSPPQVMCRSANLEAGLDVGLLARLTPGYVGSDLDSLMEAAASIADERQCAEAERLFGASPESAAKSASNEGKKDAAREEEVFAWLESTPGAKVNIGCLL